MVCNIIAILLADSLPVWLSNFSIGLSNLVIEVYLPWFNNSISLAVNSFFVLKEMSGIFRVNFWPSQETQLWDKSSIFFNKFSSETISLIAVCKLPTFVKSHFILKMKSVKLLSIVTFEIPVFNSNLDLIRAISYLTNSIEGTLTPFKLSKANIELIFNLLELRLILYLKVPVPSLWIVKSSKISIHEFNVNKVISDKNINFNFIVQNYVKGNIKNNTIYKIVITMWKLIKNK